MTIDDQAVNLGKAGGPPSGSTADDDRQRLHDMGYAQELHRGLGTFSNFAISFSIISILAGGMTSYYLGMLAGAIPKGAYDAEGGIFADGSIVTSGRVIVLAVSSATAKFLIFIAVVAQFFCGMASVTANSRMVYAFSRDGGLPFSNVWHRINPKTRTPTNAVWLGVGLSAVVGCLALLQNNKFSVAFFALTGICVIGLYIAYIIPIYLRLRNPDFKQSEWNLGKWSKPIGWISIVWVAFITILFFAPVFYPFWPPWDAANDRLKLNNFNFTGPLIVLSFLLFGLWYVASAKNWFKGPKVQGTKEELLAIERELDAFGG